MAFVKTGDGKIISIVKTAELSEEEKDNLKKSIDKLKKDQDSDSYNDYND